MIKSVVYSKKSVMKSLEDVERISMSMICLKVMLKDVFNN